MSFPPCEHVAPSVVLPENTEHGADGQKSRERAFPTEIVGGCPPSQKSFWQQTCRARLEDVSREPGRRRNNRLGCSTPTAKRLACRTSSTRRAAVARYPVNLFPSPPFGAHRFLCGSFGDSPRAQGFPPTNPLALRKEGSIYGATTFSNLNRPPLGADAPRVSVAIPLPKLKTLPGPQLW